MSSSNPAAKMEFWPLFLEARGIISEDLLVKYTTRQEEGGTNKKEK